MEHVGKVCIEIPLEFIHRCCSNCFSRSMKIFHHQAGFIVDWVVPYWKRTDAIVRAKPQRDKTTMWIQTSRDPSIKPLRNTDSDKCLLVSTCGIRSARVPLYHNSPPQRQALLLRMNRRVMKSRPQLVKSAECVQNEYHCNR